MKQEFAPSPPATPAGTAKSPPAGEDDAAERELQDLKAEFDAFSYAVSHDLRAPLRAIDGFSAILEEDYGAVMDDEGRRLLQVVRDNVQKMGRMMDELLTYSRLGRRELKPERVDLATEAGDLFESLRLRQENETSPELAVGELPPAWGDRNMLREVLRQLLENALKFTRGQPRPRIEFKGEAYGAESVFSLADNGVGFDQRYAGKLFEVFQKLHPEKQFQGTGMGLAIVRRLIRRHGGEVQGEARPEGGAVFTFTLPAEPPPAGRSGGEVVP